MEIDLKDPSNTEGGIEILGGGLDRDHFKEFNISRTQSRVGFKIGFSIQEYISNKRLMTVASLNVENALKIDEINFEIAITIFF